MTGAPGTASYQ